MKSVLSKTRDKLTNRFYRRHHSCQSTNGSDSSTTLHRQFPTTSPHNSRRLGSAKSSADRARSTRGQWKQKDGLTSGLDYSPDMESTVRVDSHPEATAELESSADWYAERSPTAARDFCLAIDATLSKIVVDPQRFARLDRRHRACSVRGFLSRLSTSTRTTAC